MVNHPNRGAPQKPTLGRIVIYRQGALDPHPQNVGGRGTNCTVDHPAIITRVWSETCVNLHVFFDAYPSELRSSVTELPALPDDVENVSGNSGWYWPPRA